MILPADVGTLPGAVLMARKTTMLRYRGYYLWVLAGLLVPAGGSYFGAKVHAAVAVTAALKWDAELKSAADWWVPYQAEFGEISGWLAHWSARQSGYVEDRGGLALVEPETDLDAPDSTTRQERIYPNPFVPGRRTDLLGPSSGATGTGTKRTPNPTSVPVAELAQGWPSDRPAGVQRLPVHVGHLHPSRHGSRLFRPPRRGAGSPVSFVSASEKAFSDLI